LDHLSQIIDRTKRRPINLANSDQDSPTTFAQTTSILITVPIPTAAAAASSQQLHIIAQVILCQHIRKCDGFFYSLHSVLQFVVRPRYIHQSILFF
jgi:hypothetical protein